MRLADLTRKQRAAVGIFAAEDNCCEADMHELWPLIRRPRLVTNALVAKGIVTLDCWDDVSGYELHLTDVGHELVREIRDGQEAEVRKGHR